MDLSYIGYETWPLEPIEDVVARAEFFMSPNNDEFFVYLPLLARNKEAEMVGFDNFATKGKMVHVGSYVEESTWKYPTDPAAKAELIRLINEGDAWAAIELIERSDASCTFRGSGFTLESRKAYEAKLSKARAAGFDSIYDDDWNERVF